MVYLSNDICPNILACTVSKLHPIMFTKSCRFCEVGRIRNRLPVVCHRFVPYNDEKKPYKITHLDIFEPQCNNSHVKRILTHWIIYRTCNYSTIWLWYGQINENYSFLKLKVHYLGESRVTSSEYIDASRIWVSLGAATAHARTPFWFVS